MIPLKLKITGFLSYNQTVELDFTSFDLACISGANGAGKSSLLDAITWVLFGRARRNNDDALINSACNMAEVVFEFNYEKGRYRVLRSKARAKTTLLEFQMVNQQGEWVALTEHTVRDTEKRIQQTLRMDYDTFINTSFFLQGKADQFAQQPAGKRKEILSSILGLEIWENYREAAANRKREIENKVTANAAWLSEIEVELAQESERVARLGQIQQDLAQKTSMRKEKETLFESFRRQADSVKEQDNMVKLLANQLEDLRVQQSTNAEQLAKRREELKQYEQVLADEQRITAANQQLSALRLELERFNQLASQYHQLDQQRMQQANLVSTEQARLEQEVLNLRQHKQLVENLKNDLQKLQAEIQTHSSQLKILEDQRKEKPKQEEHLRELQQKQADLVSENKRLKLSMDELKTRIENLETASAVCPLCGQPLTVQHRRQLLIDLQAAGKVQGDQYRQNEKTWIENEKQIAELTKCLTSYQKIDLQLQQAQADIARLHAQRQNAETQFSAWQEEGEARLIELEKMISTQDFALQVREKLATIGKSIEALGYDPQTHEDLRQKELSVRPDEDRYRALEKAHASAQPLQREIDGLEKQQKNLEEKILQQVEVFHQAEEKFKQSSAASPDLAPMEVELNTLRSQENQLRLEVGAALQLVDVLEKQKQRKQDLLAQHEEMAKRISQLEKLERAFGKNGVPALLIEQSLPDIESKANQILDRLSSGSMSLRFETQRERKNKKDEGAIQTLDILISDAAGVREYELFSGGEAFRINFAIRLALAHALAKRAGARLQTLVIDEGFGSQDADGRQRLIEAINLVMENASQVGAGENISYIRKILVITHLDGIKDAFPARVEVEKTPEGSKVQLVS